MRISIKPQSSVQCALSPVAADVNFTSAGEDLQQISGGAGRGSRFGTGVWWWRGPLGQIR